MLNMLKKTGFHWVFYPIANRGAADHKTYRSEHFMDLSHRSDHFSDQQKEKEKKRGR